MLHKKKPPKWEVGAFSVYNSSVLGFYRATSQTQSANLIPLRCGSPTPLSSSWPVTSRDKDAAPTFIMISSVSCVPITFRLKLTQWWISDDDAMWFRQGIDSLWGHCIVDGGEGGGGGESRLTSKPLSVSLEFLYLPRLLLLHLLFIWNGVGCLDFGHEKLSCTNRFLLESVLGQYVCFSLRSHWWWSAAVCNQILFNRFARSGDQVSFFPLCGRLDKCVATHYK